MQLATSNDINNKNNNTNNKKIFESASARSVDSPRSFAVEDHPQENVIPSSVVVGLLLEQVGKL